MKYGLYIFESGDWLREADKSISIWPSSEEAEKWRKNYTVHPSKYSVKKVDSKIINEDLSEMSK
jgi:hypothetical protein